MATEFTQNKFSVFIEEDGNVTEYTKHVPFPIKVSELLDEQLDEANLSLVRVDRKNVPPLTKVVIQVWNGDLESSSITEKTFFVSSDSVEELPVGSGKYTHELYLIEETKWLERFIIPATGFVNALGRTYVEK